MTPRVLAALSVLVVILGPTVGVASTAAAGEPAKNTVYTGSSHAYEVLTTATVKVGSSTKKVKKLVITQSCAGGDHRVAFRNLKIVDGAFSRDVGGEGVAADYSLRGLWWSKHKVSLTLYIRKGPCQNTFDFFAKD